jgi:hypothetical protein
MKILFNLLGRAAGLADTQPVITLFLCGAFLAVFLTVLLRQQPPAESERDRSLVWTLYRQFKQLLWAVTLISLLAGSLALQRSYLHQTLATFEGAHGRITEANYNAVQTIWGAEQTQGDLSMNMYYEEEVTERIESEDLTKPAVLRKKTVRHEITSNPFLSARHEVTLRQNPRKKGSAYYDGYETACHFGWRLRNPADRDLHSVLKFPLPAAGAMYDAISATLNGRDVLPEMQLKDAALVLNYDLKPNELLDLDISFASRGMSYWYFQTSDAQEIRDFALTLNLPDLPKAKLNYPSGCMTPTDIKPAAGGCVLTYRLSHAISNKGMGIALPSLPQPGATTNAVLRQVETGWLLVFAMLVLGLTLAGVPHAMLGSILFGTGIASVYGLLGDFSDLLPGFWTTAALVLLPVLCLIAWLLTRLVPGLPGKLAAIQLLLYGTLYPTLAGLDSDHESLYLDVSLIVFLTLAAWQFWRNVHSSTAESPRAAWQAA